MPRLIQLVIAITSCCLPFLAAAAEPGEEAIRELLSVTQARKQMDSVVAHVEGMMNATMQQMLGDRPITPAKRTVMEKMHARGIALLRQEFNWESYEAFYVAVYRQHFTQEEIDGMLQFYKSPLGQAVLGKMPALMQAGAAESQRRLGPMLERIRHLAQETYAELQALENR